MSLPTGTNPNIIPSPSTKMVSLQRVSTSTLLLQASGSNPDWKIGFEDPPLDEQEITLQTADNKLIPLSQLKDSAQQTLQFTGLVPLTNNFVDEHTDTNDASEKILPHEVQDSKTQQDEEFQLKTSTMKRREKLKHIRSASLKEPTDASNNEDEAVPNKEEPSMTENVYVKQAVDNNEETNQQDVKADKLIAEKIYKITIKEIAQKEMIYKSTRELTLTHKERMNQNRWRVVIWAREIQRWLQRSYFRNLTTLLFPLQKVIPIIERSFGTGISSFFDFWISIINLNIIVFFINLGLLMVPWFVTVQSFGELISWSVLLGLIGSDSTVIGKSWFYYGGYPAWSSTPPRYYFALVYTLCILLYFVVSLLIIFVNIGIRVRRVSNIDYSLKYSQLLLSSWDYSLNDEHAVEDMRAMLASSLRELIREDEIKEFEEKLTIKQKIILYTRRVIGIVVSILVMIAAPVTVFFTAYYYSALNSTFPYTSSLIISAVNAVFPSILDLMITIEGYEDQKIVAYNSVFRTFVVKLATTLTLVINVFSIDESTLVAEKCAANEAGIVFWQVLVINVISTSVLFPLSNIFWTIVMRSKQEFIVSAHVIELLYTQAIIWIGSAMCPMLCFLGVITNLILFLVKFLVMRFTCKFPDKPVANAKNSPFFHSFLLATLYLSSIPVMYFLGTDASKQRCGPHKGMQNGFAPLMNLGNALYDLSNSTSSNAIKTAVSLSLLSIHPVVLLAILLLFVVVAVVLLLRGNMYREKYKKAESSLNIVQQDMKALVGQVKESMRREAARAYANRKSKNE